MKRYHSEIDRTRREHRVHLRTVHNWPVEEVHYICDLQPGRFRKRKALGCGRPRCLVCHFDKVFGIKTHKDRIAELRFRDSVEDYEQS